MNYETKKRMKNHIFSVHIVTYSSHNTSLQRMMILILKTRRTYDTIESEVIKETIFSVENAGTYLHANIISESMKTEVMNIMKNRIFSVHSVT